MKKKTKRYFGDILTDEDVKRIRKEIKEEEKAFVTEQKKLKKEIARAASKAATERKREGAKWFRKQKKMMHAWVDRVEEALGDDVMNYTEENIFSID